jgi:hypothetical protein
MRVTSGNNAKGQPTRGNSADEGNNAKSFSGREFPTFKKPRGSFDMAREGLNKVRFPPEFLAPARNLGPSGICSIPNENKRALYRRKASRIVLLLFTSFRRALLGDGSLRKLTNVEQGAGTTILHTPLSGLMRERHDDEGPLCLGRIVRSCHPRN